MVGINIVYLIILRHNEMLGGVIQILRTLADLTKDMGIVKRGGSPQPVTIVPWYLMTFAGRYLSNIQISRSTTKHK